MSFSQWLSYKLQIVLRKPERQWGYCLLVCCPLFHVSVHDKKIIEYTTTDYYELGLEGLVA
ncbi:hypothetical protein, partial [Thiolapillus sp.]|uniref:hypothetical protein n=1 Tax=Thiolapillus sp. TaxID=2017437 RepID=UPI003AF6315B